MTRRILSPVVVATLLFASLLPASAQSVEPNDELAPQVIDSDPTSDRVGLVDPASGIWFLRGQNGVVGSFFYGNPGDVPFVGDWNCDGIDTPGLYRQSDGFVYLRNSNTQGPADIRFFFGNPGDFPLAGDFNNDNCDTVSIYRASEARIYVINKLGSNDGGLGAADFSYIFGNPGDKPFVGDFNGDGIDTVGLHRESTGFVYFRQSHTQGIADAQFFFGDPGDRFVTGDWGVVDNIDTPGLFRPSNSIFYFRYSNTQGIAEETLGWGVPTYLPIAGNWGVVTPGGPGTPPGGGGPGGPGGPGTPPIPPPNPAITGVLPNAWVEIPYSQQLNIVGGLPPYTVEKLGGPLWVNIGQTGLVFGTPFAPDLGNANMTVRVTDSRGASITQAVPISVVPECHGVASIPLIECQALTALYKSAAGQNWLDKTNWLSSDPCGWIGVTCEFGRVVSLDLEENNLVGTLPAQLANLTMLRTLELQQNSNTEGGTVGGLLQGTLPDFGALVNLVVLDLSENHFSGSLPPGIWNLQNLVELNLAENDLLGGPFPSTITMLSLQRLDAQEAGFHGVLPTTMTMPALTFLNLDNNDPELDGPLDVLWTLTTVTELDVSLNGFTGGVVPEIADMASLQDLDISDNQLSGPMDDGILQLADTMTEFSSNGNGCFTSSAAVDMFLSAIEPTWNEAGQCPPPPP